MFRRDSMILEAHEMAKSLNLPLHVCYIAYVAFYIWSVLRINNFFFDQNFSFLDNFFAIPLIVSSINKLIEIVQIVVIDNLHFESFHKKTHQNDRHYHKPGKRGMLSEINGHETVSKI